MTFIPDPAEQEIFDALMNGKSKFRIKCIEFVESVMAGTDAERERERKCKARAKVLLRLVEEC